MFSLFAECNSRQGLSPAAARKLQWPGSGKPQAGQGPVALPERQGRPGFAGNLESAGRRPEIGGLAYQAGSIQLERQEKYLGAHKEIFAGGWIDPESGQPLSIPIRKLVIDDDLEGREAELLADLYGRDTRMCVVTGENIWEILGRRISAALGPAAAEPIVLPQPKADLETVEQVAAATSAPVLIAVGSGAITDIVKYATFRTGRRFSIFASSPMNAYSTSSASILVDGIKKSVPTHCADGLFFELKTVAACPPRLLASAFADLICRSCIQVDWMLGRDFAGAGYREFPFRLAACDEADLIAAAGRLRRGNHAEVAILVRACIANGLGSLLLNSTACNSRSEHLISHYLDMFAGTDHPGSLHGEQVGVATLAMMRLQERILRADRPPLLKPSPDNSEKLIGRYGDRIGSQFAQNCRDKAISARQADEWNGRWREGWDAWRTRFESIMLPAADAQKALRECGGRTTAGELGFAADFYRQAVRDAMYLRNRFGILDIASSAGLLEEFIAELE